MDRRTFLKLTTASGASAALARCGHPEAPLVRFVPEETLTPGVAVWKPSLCTLCPAGCGLLVRVMEGEAEVVRQGRYGVVARGLAKKVEGNPAHPVNRGKLCARGQAIVQVLYHPDRLTQPLVSSGPRGSGRFRPLSWDEALEELVTRLRALAAAGRAHALALLTRRRRSGRDELVRRFLAAYGAPPPVVVELFSDEVLRRANALSFGVAQVPTVDLARARLVLGFGADLLATWNSPVAQMRGFGALRRGRPGERGLFVQIESRVSYTGASADEWIPVRPGTEGLVALGLAHVILNERLRPAAAAGRAGALVAGWAEGLPDWGPERVAALTGVPAARLVSLARALVTSSPAVAVIGGAPLAQTNGFVQALAVNALNALLGSVGRPGGLQFTPQPESAPLPAPQGPLVRAPRTLRALAEGILARDWPVEILWLDEANPIYVAPPAWRVRQALERIPFIVSFGSFLDDTSRFADLVLPDHAPLESWLDDVPEAGSPGMTLSVVSPALRPLYDTRAMLDVLLELAQRLGGAVAAALPWRTYEEWLRARIDALAATRGATSAEAREAFWRTVLAQGGWWSDDPGAAATAGSLKPGGRARAARERVPSGREPVAARPYAPPRFEGDPAEFPFHLLPYASLLWFDGALAHLPWLQEIPDVLSTVMWGSWVELHPQTADRLGIRTGDLVEVVSPHGRLEAPAVLSPGIAPDVVAMPVGQGHEGFTRYASGRGANPVTLLAPLEDTETGALAWAATRVHLRRVREGRLALAGGALRERPFAQAPR